MMDASDTRNPGRSAPLYQRLADRLSQKIVAGEYAPGEALPPERRLAELHDVSRITVRHALEQLSREGLVEQRRGSGTYVSSKVSQPLTKLTSLSEDVAARGMLARSKLLSCGVGVATPEEVIGLGLSPGRRISRIVRLRSADGLPLAVEASSILNEALPDPAEVGDSLYSTMEARGMRPTRAVQRLSAIALDEQQAANLDTRAGAPGLLITRIGYTPDDRPVEYTKSTFRGDRWDFVTELS
jgi:GntR family transcriptional regulator